MAGLPGQFFQDFGLEDPNELSLEELATTPPPPAIEPEPVQEPEIDLPPEPIEPEPAEEPVFDDSPTGRFEAAGFAKKRALEEQREARQREIEADTALEVRRRKDEAAVKQLEFDRAGQRSQALQTKLAAIDREAENMAEIDPRKFWKEKGTGEKIGMAFALFAGGYLQGAFGKKNPAMELFKKEMDQSIEAQKANIAKSERNLARREKRALTEDELNRIVDEKATARKKAMLSSYRGDLLRQRNAARGAKEAANTDKLIADIDEETLKTTQEYAAREEQRQLARDAQDLRERQFQEQKRHAAFQRKQAGLAAQAKAAQEIDENTVRGVLTENGQRIQAPNKKIAEELTLSVEQTSSALDKIDRLLQIESKVGREVFPTGAAKEAESVHTALLLELKELAKLGVLTGPDLELMIKQAGDPPTDFFQIGSRKKLETVRRGLDSKLRRKIQGVAPDAGDIQIGVSTATGFTPGATKTTAGAGAERQAPRGMTAKELREKLEFDPTAPGGLRPRVEVRRNRPVK